MFIHFNEQGLLLWCIPLAANHLCHILEVRIFCLKIVHLHPFQSKYSYTCIFCVTKTINHQVRWVWLFSFNSFGNTCKSYVNNDRTCNLIRQMINNMLLSSLMKWKSRVLCKDPFIFWVFQEICCGRETSNGNEATHNVKNVKFKGHH